MTKTFKVDGEMKLGEFLSAVYYMTARMKIIRRIILFSSVVAVANTILNFISPGKHNLMQTILPLLLLPLVPFLFFFILITLAGCLLYLFNVRDKNITYYFSQWGMEKRGKGTDFSTPWNKFWYYTETPKFIFLYIQENDAHIIQKRKFRNDEELESFIKFLSEYIPAAKRNRKRL